MTDFPTSLIAFEKQFPDEAACADWLLEKRWPGGFVCPHCNHDEAWALASERHLFECRSCHKRTSLTAGTLMHGSKLPLKIWFLAAFLMATHSNGISALQLKSQLGLGSYKTAWLLLAKLRIAMVAPDRDPLSGVVEVDETQIPYRRKDEPPSGGQGRSPQGKILVAGAVEVTETGQPKRARLAVIEDASSRSLHAFLSESLVEGSTALTDGWRGYRGAEGITHEPHTVGPMAAHIVLPWTHRVFSNLKTWALGVYHGLRKKHLQRYLVCEAPRLRRDEFVFRFNRRQNRPAAFSRLLGIVTVKPPTTYKMLIALRLTG
jgi:hypothetical protein